MTGACAAHKCSRPATVAASFQTLGTGKRFAIRLLLCEDHSLAGQRAALGVR